MNTPEYTPPSREEVALPEGFADTTPDVLRTWLAGAMKERGLTYLLAHADDGVIWGRLDDGVLQTSGDRQLVERFTNLVAQTWVDGCMWTATQLRLPTLQFARAFGAAGELRLWCANATWQAWFVKDGGPTMAEDQMLWGTQALTDGRWSLLRDGQQGLIHLAPVTVETDRDGHRRLERPLRLRVRHTLGADPDSGIVSIVSSRLVDLTVVKEVAHVEHA